MIQQSPVKTERFLNAINKAALEKCGNINKQIEAMMKKELEDAQKRIDSQNHKRIARETAKIKAKYKTQVAAYHKEFKDAIYKKRLGYQTEIFEKAKEKIEAFVNSDDYKAFLINAANEVSKKAGDNCTVYLSRNDAQRYGEAVMSCFNNAKLSVDSAIKLGGVKVKDYEKGILFDNSIDSEFEQQKTWFLNNASLNIDIE